MTDKEKIDYLKELLERARAGIEWYMRNQPNEVSDADYEILQEIDEALND